MSIAATNWAFAQRGLKPATKLVLVYLADCHNGYTKRCDPSQAALAEECGMSRSTLNVHLNALEASGLIRRVQRTDKRTRKQENTLYILGCDAASEEGQNGGDDAAETDPKTAPETAPETGPKTANPVSGNRTRKSANPVSGKQPIPCPENGQSRVRTVGHEPESNQKGTLRAPAREAPPIRDVCEMMAERINNGKHVTVSAIGPGMARQMLERELVSSDDLDRLRIAY